MSDNTKPTRPSIDPNLLTILVAVVTIIGANFGITSTMSSSLRNEMDTRFNSIEQRLDRIDDRFDGIDDRLERIDAQLYDLNGRLARVESGVFGYEPPAPLETPSEDQSSPLPETTPAPDPVAGL